MDVGWGAATVVQDGRLAALGWLGREMGRQPDLEATLGSVVRQARRADLGDAVGVLMVQGRRIAVAAASDAEVRRADELQLESRQGPGVEAILTRQSSIADDLRLDGRWRFWGPQAARLGWLSVLSVGLADGDTFGSLTLYSRQVRSFSPTDVAVAETFAAHAAIAVGNARERQSLFEVVRARRLLRSAQRILANRLQVDAEQAFMVLHQEAARSSRRMSDVAADLVAGRAHEPSPSHQDDAAS
jgi:GAF domain-containing protein